MSYFSKEEFAGYDSNRVTVSGLAANEMISEIKAYLFDNPVYQDANSMFQKYIMAALDGKSLCNPDYVAKAACNQAVVDRLDFALVDNINSVRVWGDNGEKIERFDNGKEVVLPTNLQNDFREVMDFLTSDDILSRDDAADLVHAVSSTKTITEVKTLITLYQSDTFQASSKKFQDQVLTLFKNASQNREYLATAVSNENVIAREDITVLNTILAANPSIPHDLGWQSGLTKDEIRSVLQQELTDYITVMKVLTSDRVLDQDHAANFMERILDSKTSSEAKQKLPQFMVVMEEAKQNLAQNGTFLATSRDFQENVFDLLDHTTANHDYLAIAVSNSNLIAREDSTSLKLLADATTFLPEDKSWLEGLSEMEVHTVLQQELDNYKGIMANLTSAQVLDRDDAASIIGSTFTCTNSSDALAYTNQFVQNVDDLETGIDMMITEATAPQVENTGFSK